MFDVNAALMGAISPKQVVQPNVPRLAAMGIHVLYVHIYHLQVTYSAPRYVYMQEKCSSQCRMKDHLAKCFRNKHFTPFPNSHWVAGLKVLKPLMDAEQLQTELSYTPHDVLEIVHVP